MMIIANKCVKLLDRFLPTWFAYIQLARLNRPIGIYLLLWPTLWALWLASQGCPSCYNLFAFVFGVILTRSAGCVINDVADRKVDGYVERTCQRPLVLKIISTQQAIVFCIILFIAAFLIVLGTNTKTILLSCVALLLALIYPFAKRYTHLPQVVLGAAFSCSIPMAFTAEINDIPPQVWLLYIGNLLWTVAYDTQYAMVDRDDDVKVGIKSTAILFGELDNLIIAVLQISFLATMWFFGDQQGLLWPFDVSLIVAAFLFIYQHTLTFHRHRKKCFQAFLSNHWVGVAVFCGIVGALLLTSY